MRQTQAHERHNADLLAILPTDAERIIEVGCSSGALAREYKKINPHCHYIGIEIEPEYAELAKRHCDKTFTLDVEQISGDEFDLLFPSDCWIFGDTLEHLRDPWSTLSRIRAKLSNKGCVAACIPNAQHWSVQAKLNSGRFFYEESGLFDKSHLRWFTRTTIHHLFEISGLHIEAAIPRVFHEPNRERVADAIRLMAQSIGMDPEQAVLNAMPFQYVIRAIPA